MSKTIDLNKPQTFYYIGYYAEEGSLCREFGTPYFPSKESAKLYAEEKNIYISEDSEYGLNVHFKIREYKFKPFEYYGKI